MTEEPAYAGRQWLLATRETGLWPLVAWGLRRSTANRAMLLPFLGCLASTAVAFHLLRAAALGAVHPALGTGVTLVVFWPLALVLALSMDLMRKEHRLRTYLRRVDPTNRVGPTR